MAEGVVHESMNLAGVQDLPVVFICENNQYGEMTPVDEQHHEEGFEARGDVYDMPAETVDGMSIQTVYDATEYAVERARNGEGSSLVICETYRYRGHYEGDPMTYRTDEEVEQWRERDPIDSLESSLIEGGQLNEDDVAEMREDSSDRIDAAVEFARESDYPAEGTAFEDVYSEEI